MGLTVAVAIAWPPPVRAEQTYVVTGGANVRAAPSTESERIENLERGARVVGTPAERGWIRVRTKDGKSGYISTNFAAPVLDGALKAPLAGRATAPETECRYLIRFIGRSPAVDGIETADYDALWTCTQGGRTISFDGHMFLVETPTLEGSEAVHQVTVDLRDVADDTESTVSATFLYRRAGNRLVFESVEPKGYAAPRARGEAPAASVAQALEAAVQLAIGVWGPAVWTELKKRTE